MHAPNAQSQRECTAASPENAAPAMSRADTLRDFDGDVGAQGGDHDREKDEAKAVRLLDHARRTNRLKKKPAITFGLLLDFHERSQPSRQAQDASPAVSVCSDECKSLDSLCLRRKFLR